MRQHISYHSAGDPTLAGSFSLNNTFSQKVGKKKGKKKKSKIVNVIWDVHE